MKTCVRLKLLMEMLTLAKKSPYTLNIVLLNCLAQREKRLCLYVAETELGAFFFQLLNVHNYLSLLIYWGCIVEMKKILVSGKFILHFAIASIRRFRGLALIWEFSENLDWLAGNFSKLRNFEVPRKCPLIRISLKNSWKSFQW